MANSSKNTPLHFKTPKISEQTAQACDIAWFTPIGDQIEGVCVIRKRGLIEVSGGHRSLTVDARINAPEYLLSEIRQRAGIDPRVIDGVSPLFSSSPVIRRALKC